MIVYKDPEKAFDKIQHPNPQQSEVIRNIPQNNKGHTWKTHS